ncbi:phosphatase PAP2/dual specificity phosphatase family protein [Motilimonas cestriensis]|uniref:phosphatase PAP2/dual specificity phosphatase family protein n=1 Tax=Motilimonas cestriensis TaxID=2742685 RepID=UPI003DA65C5A
MSKPLSHVQPDPILWWRGLAWLALLAPLFFITYNGANQYAASLPEVSSVVFAWERHIPLLPWTIIPYWSIDLLYGLAFLLPRQRKLVDALGLRLLTAQVVCISCFLLWPLHFSVERPELTGVFGTLFDILMGFDKPYNQAPSLHITLLIVLWACFAQHLKGVWRWLTHGWFALIGLSVLTTWQHHFIDLPTGVLAGFFCIWCWPNTGRSPLLFWRHGKVKPHYALASYYGLAGILCGVVAAHFSGVTLILLWPCVSLLLVAFNYTCCGAMGFQKQDSGRLSLAATVLFTPYLVGAWLNSRLWTRGQATANEVVNGVWLGRKPSASEAAQYVGLMDMCPELPIRLSKQLSSGNHYQHLDVLDLTPLSAQQCWQAAKAIDSLNHAHYQPILVYCALGYSRSSVALMAWLLLSGQAQTPESAKGLIEQARPQAVIKAYHLAALAQMQLLPEFINYQRHRAAVAKQNKQHYKRQPLTHKEQE